MLALLSNRIAQWLVPGRLKDFTTFGLEDENQQQRETG